MGHYYVDFMRSCVNLLRGELDSIVAPTLSCLCSLIRMIPTKSIHDGICFHNALVLTKCVHMLLNYSILPFSPSSDPFKPAGVISGMIPGERSSLLGLYDFVKDVVFHSNLPSPIKSEIHAEVLNMLPLLVKTLLRVYSVRPSNIN